MSEFLYRPANGDADVDALSNILALCFGGSREDSRKWTDRLGSENARLVTEGARVLGGSFHIPMGQWFGGRSVPMAGIGGVGVDPGYRASGAATHLMQETVRELHGKGTALSTLFPAVQPLYRRAGYEQAGAHFRVKVSPGRLFLKDRALTLRRATNDDQPGIERLQQQRGRENDGNLDRNDVMWLNVREPFRGDMHTFVVEGAAGLEGYVIYKSTPNARGHQDLQCADLVARTPGAARRLLSFFRDHRSLVDSVTWRGHPADPLLLQAQEQRHDVKLWDTWMLRIVDVESALKTRGWPQHAREQIHFEVTDDVVAGNEGRWTLTVEEGHAEVVRGGEGRVRLDVRSLAPLYTGFASPAQLRRGHGLICDDGDAARLAALFGGSYPWMQDTF